MSATTTEDGDDTARAARGSDETAWSRNRAANRDGSMWPRHRYRARQKRAHRRQAARERAVARRRQRRGGDDG